MSLPSGREKKKQKGGEKGRGGKENHEGSAEARASWVGSLFAEVQL